VTQESPRASGGKGKRNGWSAEDAVIGIQVCFWPVWDIGPGRRFAMDESGAAGGRTPEQYLAPEDGLSCGVPRKETISLP